MVEDAPRCRCLNADVCEVFMRENHQTPAIKLFAMAATATIAKGKNV
jgi:hypothetical protein